jgi:hypothetical protein
LNDARILCKISGSENRRWIDISSSKIPLNPEKERRIENDHLKTIKR